MTNNLLFAQVVFNLTTNSLFTIIMAVFLLLNHFIDHLTQFTAITIKFNHFITILVHSAKLDHFLLILLLIPSFISIILH